MKVLLFVSAMFALAALSSAKFEYKDCGGPVGKLMNISITGCSDSPCQVKKGNKYSIAVTFMSAEAADEAWAVVHGVLDGQAVPYPLDNPNGCKDSGIECPLKMNTAYTYKSSLTILNAFPEIKVVVKWELQDAKSSGKDFFCFETLVEVVG